ncbi:MAG: molybdopterin-dependent oxidoreductase [Verrucomicrobia bacterium]|nr:molybdopterin-dependent oxidoreductase [Verrucomicrobiota bacterium]MBV8485588.1 molybdopterin-dependent oxidoreductase [Verrucomicrobiota bacterium]
MVVPVNKNSDFIFHQETPPNGGPPLARLIEKFATPVQNFFLRTHGDIPEVNRSTFRLTIAGLVKRPCEFTLAELGERFPAKAIVATLQCAGNRRSSASAIKPVPNEVRWGNEAISNAGWKGCSLTDVLQFAGVDDQAKHVEFVGADRCSKEGTEVYFGGSIPLDRALQRDVLLAWEMNDRPLATEHGAPLRAIVPGYIGARSVKWLKEINLLIEPSKNLYHAHAYRLFPSDTSSASADWEHALELGELSVNSCICAIEEVPNGVLVKGYATAGGNRHVVRVDIGFGEPLKWREASFQDPPGPGIWRRWEVLIPKLLVGEIICARAWDSAANTQPEDPESVWNFKGYMNNAWHRVRFGMPWEDVKVAKPEIDYYL